MRDESTKRGTRLRRHVRSNLVGYLALAVSLSLAPAYASHLIVRTSDIKNGAVTTPKLANRAVTAKKLARQPNFIGATLEPGFTNLGGGYRPAGFMKDTLGFVHLRGVMDCPCRRKHSVCSSLEAAASRDRGRADGHRWAGRRQPASASGRRFGRSSPRGPVPA